MKSGNHSLSTLPNQLKRIALAGFCCLCLCTAAEDNKDWPHYNYDLRGSRFNRFESSLSSENADRLVEKWRFPREDSNEKVGVIQGTPLAVEGFVYFGTMKTNPAFYKLSPSGKLIWKFPIPSRMTLANQDPYALIRGEDYPDGVISSGLVTSRYVFFGTFGGQIFCLDRFNGTEVWSINSKSAPFPGAHPANTVMASPILAEGMLIVAGGAFEHVVAAIPGYSCCEGRGYVMALDPENGNIIWKYDVGPEPEVMDPPLTMKINGNRTRTFAYGPSTSSVWCTPSFDESSGTLFFGTDTHNAPRKPTQQDARLYNEYSSAVIALNIRDGSEKWVRQVAPNDVWNSTLPNWEESTGQFKDTTVGDTPKLYEVMFRGHLTPVVGAGCKNGSFYVIDRRSGAILFQTPTYVGPPSPADRIADPGSRILALPSAIGGLQTGCAFDGERIYVNGIDFLGMANSPERQGADGPPAAGRVTSIRPDALAEIWRHERPKIMKYRSYPGGPEMVSGDPVASGIAVANDVLFFTTTVSGRMIALNSETGALLKEFELGAVWCGPSISRGRVYVGSGNILFEPWTSSKAPPKGFQFPLTSAGILYSFGLPGQDEVDRLAESE